MAFLCFLPYNIALVGSSKEGRAMELERILALVLFSILHLVLAIMLLQDLANREQVVGGRKAPWAIAIIFVTFLGSLVYLLCHPKIFYDSNGK